jgi:flagellar hook-basal body complex protein FliE
MLNTQQASFGFQLAVQVRNKLVEAYQDIMRMSL